MKVEAIAHEAADALAKALGPCRVLKAPGRWNWKQWRVSFKEGEESLAISALVDCCRRHKIKRFMDLPGVSTVALIEIGRKRGVSVRCATQYRHIYDDMVGRLDVMSASAKKRNWR